MDAKYKILLRCPLFIGLNEPELEELLETVTFKEGKFAKDEILANQNEICNRLIILLSGNVRAQMIDDTGKIMKVEDLYAPSPLATIFLFGERNRFPVEVAANMPVEAIIFSKETILTVFQQNRKVLLNYLNLSSMYANRLSDKLYFLSFKTIRQKISNYLLKLPEKDNIVILDRSQNSLAEYFGVTRPSLSRELANMQADGLIKMERKKVEILKLKH
jgi:CRP-like cAMP-binding protein